MDVGNRHFRYPACPCGVTASMTAFQAVDTGSIPVMGSKYFSGRNFSDKEDFIMPDNKQLVLDGFGESAYIR